MCTSDSIKLLPDLKWIEDKGSLGTVLSDKLKEIRDAKRDTLVISSYLYSDYGMQFSIIFLINIFLRTVGMMYCWIIYLRF